MNTIKTYIGLFVLAAFAGISLLSAAICAAAPTEAKARILCYGDSNTWGWIPQENAYPTKRYAPDVRWTGILQAKLGDRYLIIEEGLNGRTAGADDYGNYLDADLAPYLNLNGEPTFLPIFKSQSPVDLVVIMLGSNDVRPYLKQDAKSIAASVGRLVRLAKNSARSQHEWLAYGAPKILVVAPVPLQLGKSEVFNEFFKGGHAISSQIGRELARVARENDVEYIDLTTVVPVADGVDGIHLSPASHKKIAGALYKKIKSLI